MPSRYHPIYGGLWTDSRLDGLSFECRAFFAFLCSNDRVRPSGIYRASDAQLAADADLPIVRVRAHLKDLVARGRIVRDDSWIFVRGYLARQPKQQFLLSGAEADVTQCPSLAILEAFDLKYPLYNRWSTKGRARVKQRSPADADADADADAVLPAGIAPAAATNRHAPPAATPQFRVPDSVKAALARCAKLGGIQRLHDAVYWQAQVRAHQGVDYAAELLRAEAWLAANPRAARRDLPRFMQNWLARAAQDAEG